LQESRTFASYSGHDGGLFLGKLLAIIIVLIRASSAHAIQDNYCWVLLVPHAKLKQSTSRFLSQAVLAAQAHKGLEALGLYLLERVEGKTKEPPLELKIDPTQNEPFRIVIDLQWKRRPSRAEIRALSLSKEMARELLEITMEADDFAVAPLVTATNPMSANLLLEWKKAAIPALVALELNQGHRTVRDLNLWAIEAMRQNSSDPFSIAVAKEVWEWTAPHKNSLERIAKAFALDALEELSPHWENPPDQRFFLRQVKNTPTTEVLMIREELFHELGIRAARLLLAENTVARFSKPKRAQWKKTLELVQNQYVEQFHLIERLIYHDSLVIKP